MWVLPVIGVLVFAGSLLLGRYPRAGFIGPVGLLQDPMAMRVVWLLRLPRVLAAVCLGASLATAGCAFQMLFRNPLVEPGFLGVTQGAAFGAALAILTFSRIPGAVQACAVLFAVAGVALSYYSARKLRFGGWGIRMVISGVCVSALFAAGLGVLKYAADPLSELQEMTFWMLGGLGGITWGRLAGMAFLAVPGLLLLLLFRWRFNVLSLDDLTAFSMGTNPARERLLLLGAASVAVAGVTAAAGVIGWVGLLVPHVARRLYGPQGEQSVPASLLLGSILTMVCDGAARSLFPYEIPLGILTSLLGALLFLLLLTSGGVRIGG